MSIMENTIINQLKENQILRISCSDIAGVCGFNPWSKIDILFEKYLYQDLNELYELDAEHLETSIITVEEQIYNVINKLDENDKKILANIDKNVLDNHILNNNTKAEEFLIQIKTLMNNKSIQSKIDIKELKLIEDEYKGRICKNYGINCENKLLDKYEDYSGFKVIERNLNSIKMSIMPSSEITTNKSMDIIAKNISIESRIEVKENKLMKDAFAELALASKKLYAELSFSIKEKQKRKRIHPSFILIGRVDGISHQLDMSSDNVHDWKPIKVVVEMKSRVKRITYPPPLYEQIQLVSYMLILDCPCGDLVQAIAENNKTQSNINNNNNINNILTNNIVDNNIDNNMDNMKSNEIVTNSNHSSNSSDLTIANDSSFNVTRISLDGPPYYHRKYWDNIIMPRLKIFKDSIYTMRMDNELRYKYLQSTYEEKVVILNSLISYIELIDE